MSEHLRIAAGVVLTDSRDTLSLILENFISQGITDFYVLDHLSEPPLNPWDFSHFVGRANIRLVHKKTSPFYQGALMSYLVYLAQLEEFEVFIPFDSDEFHLPLNHNENLRRLISSHFDTCSDIGFQIKVQDFVQSSDSLIFDLESALRVRYRVKNPEVKIAKDVNVHNFSILDKPIEYKIIFKLDSNSTYLVSEGSHQLKVNNSALTFLPLQSIVIGHVPYRSRTSLLNKARLGERRIEAGFGREIGWQNQILARATEEDLNLLWARNSYTLDRNGVVLLGGIEDCLEYDLLLVNLFNRLLISTREKVPVKGQKVFDTMTNFEDSLSYSLDLLGAFIRVFTSSERDSAIGERDSAIVERDSAIVERDSAIVERDSAIGERDSAIVERDSAIVERDSILNSTIWALFAPYRKVKNLFRKS